MTLSVLTVAPLRMSFSGGGSDIRSYFSQKKGAVLSCSIDKYVFVHVKIHDDTFGERYRISYSEVEHVQEIGQIRNDIVRNCLTFMEIDEPVQISTLSDLPMGAGLGSSSSFTVALLLALHELKNEKPTKHQLAEEACHVEIEMLKHPIGKQDQYAAAFGGLNFLVFQSDGRVKVEPIAITSNRLDELLHRCRLYWTQVIRSASKILADQGERTSQNVESINRMVSLTYELRETLEEENMNWGHMANLINDSWNQKKLLSPLIASSSIDEMITSITKLPNFAAKLLGAGGGASFCPLMDKFRSQMDLTPLTSAQIHSCLVSIT